MTRRLFPDYLSVEDWRRICRNNRLGSIAFTVATTRSWLPHALTDLGFFKSGSEVKRNRADLWRDIEDGEVVTVGFARIRIVACTGFVDVG